MHLALCLVIVAGALAGSPGGNHEERYEYAAVKMGVPFKIVLYAPGRAAANSAAAAVWSKIDDLNRLLSDYDPQSELSRLSQSSPHEAGIAVSDPLWQVLVRADAISRSSDGAFDVTVGPAVKLWRQARQSKLPPSPARLAAARAAIGYRAVELDPTNHTVRLRKPHMQLDLGGIAIGYTVDQALKLLKDRGIPSALVDASGDIGVSDPPPGRPGWRIGIAPLAAEQPPSRYLILKNAAVTTSGDAFRYVELGGVRYSHILDPQTGLGLTRRSSVTVVAPDCMSADALTKAVSVLGPERGLQLIDREPGAACLFVEAGDDEAGHPKTYESTRFKELTFAGPDEKSDGSEKLDGSGAANPVPASAVSR